VLDADGSATGAALSTALSPYLFTARRFDAAWGLYYFRNRYYSPLLGKFISPDPLDYVDGMNVYAYVNGNVANRIDPFGLAGYFFDGTCNIPSDQTNVHRLFQTYNGMAYYAYGIGSGFHADGTPYTAREKALGLSPAYESATGSSMEDRVEWMLGNVDKQLASGDNVIDLFGFSRGSASATLFLNKIQERIESKDPKYEKYKKTEIRFVALFDQVPSKRRVLGQFKGVGDGLYMAVRA
jgi:RHS repeat-associated protein